MGLLKKIGKGFKKVFKGIGKVFKKVFKGLGKFLSSKWGKGLMIALSVFTMGTALMAGAAAWNTAAQAGTSFLGKFVAASKGFIGAMIGTGGAAKDAAGAGVGVGAEQAAAGAAEAAGAVQGAAGAAGDIAATVADPLTGIAEAATAGAGPVDVAGELGKTFADVGTKVSEGLRGFTPASGQGNMLTKMLKGGGEFVKSTAGSQLIGSVLKGYAESKSLEEMEKRGRKETRRFNRLWAESDIDTRPIFNIKTPTQGGQSSAARNVSQFTPRVTYGGSS